MFCNKCGKENKVESKFCFNCGNKLEENNNIDNIQVSAKVGYYSRIVSIILLIINIGIILFGVISMFSNTSSSDDSIGYALLILIFIGPVILLGYLFGSTFLTIVLPSIWISKNKKVDTWVEVFRFIGLIFGFIIILIPFFFLVWYLLTI